MNTAAAARANMINQQIRPWEVLDHQVLSTLDRIRRDDFVSASYRGLAYADCQIPLGDGVRMLPPTIEGRMLQALMLGADDSVLEVGCASGFITACLASLAAQVTSVDSNPALLELARQNVAAYAFDNVEFRLAGLQQLDQVEAYDAIAVSGSMPAVPNNLRLALKLDGRLFVVIGQSPVMQALLITRVGANEWNTQSLFETDLPRLAG